MLTDDVRLSRDAEEVLAKVTALYKIDTREELDDQRNDTRDAIRRLVMTAKRHL